MTKKEFLEKELKELERVGKVKFNSWLDPKLIHFDLSVIKNDQHPKSAI